MNKKPDAKAVVLLMMTVTGLVAVLELGGLLNRLQGNVEQSPEQVILSYCDVATTCSVRLDEGIVDLTINPASMPVLRPLDIIVNLTGIEAERVSMEFAGRDMPMALEPLALRKSEQGIEKERYTGTGSISFCSSDQEMVWLARINITTKTNVQTVVFELDTSRS